MALLVLGVTVALLAAAVPTAHGHTYRHPVYEFGGDVQMPCVEERDVTLEEFVHWVDPYLTVYDTQFPGNNRRRLVGFAFNISRVEENDMGDYLCQLEIYGRPVYYKTTLYLYIPGVWETYRWNFILGLSFAAATFVVMTLLCVGYTLINKRKVEQRRANAGMDPYSGGAEALPPKERANAGMEPYSGGAEALPLKERANRVDTRM